jgi:hypothetical protein
MYISIYQHIIQSCSIQDNSIGLCNTEVDSSDHCQVDESSKYYAHFFESNKKTETCVNTQYPACICSGMLACGPYVNSENAFEPLRAVMTRNSGIQIIWDYLISSSYGAWILLFSLLLLYSMTINTLKVPSQISIYYLSEF